MVSLCLLACSALFAKEKERKPVAVEGTIVYTGPVPMGVYVVEANATREVIVVDKEKRLKDAVVWLEGVKGAAQPKKEAIVIDQQNYFFIPSVLAIAAGQEVEFLNSDGANHGVMAASPEGKNSFNIVTPPGQSHKHQFVSAKQPVRIGCPLHAGMGAWVCVFDHPYFAVTDKAGQFQLPAVPPGKYKLWVRHLDGGMKKSQQVTVEEGKPLSLRIEFTKDDLP